MPVLAPEFSLGRLDGIRFARCIDPPLATAAQPMRAIGEGIVALRLAILARDAKAPDSVTLPHTLTIRASTAPRRAPPVDRGALGAGDSGLAEASPLRGCARHGTPADRDRGLARAPPLRVPGSWPPLEP